MLISNLSSLNPILLTHYHEYLSTSWHEERVNLLKQLIARLDSLSLEEASTFSYFLKYQLLRYQQRSYFAGKAPRGLCLHLCPGNVPILSLYSWSIAFITGNVSIVRLSSRTTPQELSLIQIVSSFLEDSGYLDTFVSATSPSSFLEKLSTYADVRLIWGSDQTVSLVKSSFSKASCLDIPFSSKISCLILPASSIITSLSPKEKSLLSNTLYYQHTAPCTAPSTLYIIQDSDVSLTPKDVAVFLANLFLDSSYSAKYNLSTASLKEFSLQKFISLYSGSVYRCDNSPITYTVNSGLYEAPLYHYNLVFKSSLSDIRTCNSPVQTLSYLGYSYNELLASEQLSRFCRIKPVGYTHLFSLDWDGYSLASMLTYHR